MPQMHLWLKTEAPSGNGDRATVHIMGLPALRFRADDRLPRERQPLSIDITLNAGQLTVGLAYDLEKDWPEAERESAGVDPGVASTLTASDSDGQRRHYCRPDESECDRRTRRLRRKLQRQRDAALADGRARWASRRNRKGQPKKRFRWNGAPSRSYLKTLRQLPSRRARTLRPAERLEPPGIRGTGEDLPDHLLGGYQGTEHDPVGAGNRGAARDERSAETGPQPQHTGRRAGDSSGDSPSTRHPGPAGSSYQCQRGTPASPVRSAGR